MFADPIGLPEKERALRAWLRARGRVVVAFSGGIDSALLVQVAAQELGGSACAALAVSPSLPRRDREDAERLAREIGTELVFVETDEFEDPRYLENRGDRCYWCRKALVRALVPLARRRDAVLAYGAVTDDLADDRPGMRAAAEGGVTAPLIECGFAKADVRALARRLGLSAWDKPASACLSSRIPAGTPVEPALLRRIDDAERGLAQLGFAVVRVRAHGEMARIELGPGEIERMLDPAVRTRAVEAVRAAGFARVCLDLEGYRAAGPSRLPSAR
ncbi:MAG: ATP-dependent sacrificial sulfur transferase LarE [Acidobacteria bacterium]|nr:ATP-dependent sacrificial sulfur transferase LarE [Acidobacteriota bacterium]